MKNYLSSFFIILAVIGTAYAQEGNQSATTLANAKRSYTEKMGYQSRLYNGIKFVDYPLASYIGNAYWGTNEFQNANLHYDGADFYNIPILYNTHRETIIITTPVDTSKIVLINEKLDRFSVGNHAFVRIDDPSKQIAIGFYELLYNGKSQYVKKYTKDIVQENIGYRIDYIFKEHNTYYLLKDNVYNPVSGEKSILNLFKDKKAALEQFIKTNKIVFNAGNEEQAMAKVITYYDQLHQ